MTRKIVSILLVLTMTVPMIGCRTDILSPNESGTFAFSIGTTEFTYTPGSRVGTMVIHNPTSFGISVNIKIEDGFDRASNLWIGIGPHATKSYDDQYSWGTKLRIEIRRYDMTTVNYVKLGG